MEVLSEAREAIEAARQWSAEGWRAWRQQLDENDPPAVDAVKERRAALREHVEALEQVLDELADTRRRVLRGEAEGDPAELREARTAVEAEIEDLEVVQDGLISLHKVAESRAWRSEVVEHVAELPGLADRHRRAKDQVAAVEAEVRRIVGDLLHQAHKLAQRGSPAYLEDAELERLQAVVDEIPGLHGDLATYLKAPPEDDLNEPKIILTADEDGKPVRRFVGDWDEGRLAAAGGLDSHDNDGARVVHEGVTS